MKLLLLFCALFQVPSAPAAPRIAPNQLPSPQRPTPRQGVPTQQAVATVTMFWDQSAPTLATVTGSYLYGYYIDCNQTTGTCSTQSIQIQATCTDKNPPVQSLFGCTGQMTSLMNGTHTYTLEVQCASCADPKNVKSNPVSYTYGGASTVAAASSIMIESGSGANIPPQTQIVDSYGAIWTQSSTVPASCPPSVVGHPPTDCLTQYRNSVSIGLGRETYYKNQVIYVLGPQGPEMHWWKYNNSPNCPQGDTNTCWTDVGTTKP